MDDNCIRYRLSAWLRGHPAAPQRRDLDQRIWRWSASAACLNHTTQPTTIRSLSCHTLFMERERTQERVVHGAKRRPVTRHHSFAIWRRERSNSACCGPACCGPLPRTDDTFVSIVRDRERDVERREKRSSARRLSTIQKGFWPCRIIFDIMSKCGCPNPNAGIADYVRSLVLAGSPRYGKVVFSADHAPR